MPFPSREFSAFSFIAETAESIRSCAASFTFFPAATSLTKSPALDSAVLPTNLAPLSIAGNACFLTIGTIQLKKRLNVPPRP